MAAGFWEDAVMFLGFAAPWALIGWVACQQWNDHHTSEDTDDTRGDLP